MFASLSQQRIVFVWVATCLSRLQPTAFAATSPFRLFQRLALFKDRRIDKIASATCTERHDYQHQAHKEQIRTQHQAVKTLSNPTRTSRTNREAWRVDGKVVLGAGVGLRVDHRACANSDCSCRNKADPHEAHSSLAVARLQCSVKNHRVARHISAAGSRASESRSKAREPRRDPGQERYSIASVIS